MMKVSYVANWVFNIISHLMIFNNSCHITITFHCSQMIVAKKCSLFIKLCTITLVLESVLLPHNHGKMMFCE